MKFHLAVCQECSPTLPIPFSDEAERDEWAEEHATGTGHFVRSEGPVWKR